MTAIWDASWKGHLLCVNVLLSGGADPNIARTDTDNGSTPIYAAVHQGHNEVVLSLLSHGADPNKATTDDGRTPVYVAAIIRHFEN